ncbi:MAG: hypothetical protein IJW40_06150 [Clostridia bacterium]|nr:hypothetical protein [Clostridia bacterium]
MKNHQIFLRFPAAGSDFWEIFSFILAFFVVLRKFSAQSKKSRIARVFRAKDERAHISTERAGIFH